MSDKRKPKTKTYWTEPAVDRYTRWRETCDGPTLCRLGMPNVPEAERLHRTGDRIVIPEPRP